MLLSTMNPHTYIYTYIHVHIHSLPHAHAHTHTHTHTHTVAADKRSFAAQDASSQPQSSITDSGIHAEAPKHMLETYSGSQNN
jgi:hypothetical protein